MSSSVQRARSLRKTWTQTTEGAPAAPRPQPHRASPPTDDGGGDSPSRLPVKPPRPTAGSSSTTAGARGGGNRPIVSATLGRSASSSQTPRAAPQEPVRRESTTTRRTLSSVANKPPARTRPVSAASTSTAAAQGRPAPAHSRTRSSVTSLPHHVAAALRPPSRNRHSVSSVSTRPSTTARAASTSTAAKAALPPSTPPAIGASRPAHQPRLRPAFSTLQQHYSPAKNLAPKPLTSTYIAPPSPSKLPANVAASTETNRRQVELLQLHFLHRDAAPVQAKWQASARHKLGRRFATLSEASRALADRQRAGLERDNLLALGRWGSSGKGLDEKIQLLGDIVTGLWTLSEPGGRYDRTVRRFQRWALSVRDVDEARSSARAAAPQSQDAALFIDELDATCREECAAMTRRLRHWRSQLEDIDDLAPTADEVVDGQSTSAGSSLERMLAGARSLAQGMLAELQAMEDMEREALAREDEWVERMNRDNEGESAAAGPVWTTM